LAYIRTTSERRKTIYAPAMARREQEILEHAIHAVTEQAAKAET
jgi:hypothetical protein